MFIFIYFSTVRFHPTIKIVGFPLTFYKVKEEKLFLYLFLVAYVPALAVVAPPLTEANIVPITAEVMKNTLTPISINKGK